MFSSSVERFNFRKYFEKCENIEFCVYRIKVGDRKFREKQFESDF